jgi:acylphosphatase
MTDRAVAIRATGRGEVQGVWFRDATVWRARELGVLGWVRIGDDDAVPVHAEGAPTALDELTAARPKQNEPYGPGPAVMPLEVGDGSALA